MNRMSAITLARCYRCLDLYPEAQLCAVRAGCGCEHAYCEACLAAPRFGAWLVFLGSRCRDVLRGAA